MANYLFLLPTLALVCLILANEASAKSVDIPSGRFQLQNPASGKCAIIPNHSNTFWEKIVSHKCRCDDEYQFWTHNQGTLVSQGGIKQCMANWEALFHPGITQCLCDFLPIHKWRFSANDDGTFSLASAVDGRCASVDGGSEGHPLEFDECDWQDADQKFVFYDACHPTPPPTPKPAPPPPTPAPPPPAPAPPPPQPINVIPGYLVYFFNNGNMNWLTPTRYTLLVGGHWDAVTLTWYTVDGRQIKPNTDMWTMYFGDTSPSFLGALFPGGKTWNDVFGWMTIDFFKTWNPTPSPTPVSPIPPPPQPNVIPSYLSTYFTNGQMNWLSPQRYSLLVGGRWDPVNYVWYTADGRQIRPSTTDWTTYFGDLQPSQLSVFFPNGGSWNDVFGWITPSFFQTWLGSQQSYNIPMVVPYISPGTTQYVFQ